jgi:hypothetical protein
MNIESLKGLTVTEISGAEKGSERVEFVTSGGRFAMYHSQDCCESVELEDICGDISDLLDSEILLAEEVTNSDDIIDGKPAYPESWTWTFYKLSTIKGHVTLRWLGESNGYYSEGVYFEKMS